MDEPSYRKATSLQIEEEPLDIGNYVDILKRRKWHLIIPAILIMLITGVIGVLLPSIYRSTATILIEEQDIPADFVMTTVTGYAEQRIQSTKQRIMSTSKLMEIIDRFDLYAKYKERWTIEQIVGKMRKDIRLNLISADTIDRRTGRATTATIAFTLSYRGKHPATVQKVADTLVSLFLSENLQVRRRQTTETTEFLEEESRRVKDQVAVLEEKIAVFKAKHLNYLPEMFQVNQQTLNTTELTIERIDNQIRMLKEREGYLQTQLASIPEMQDPEKERLKMLELELVNLKSRYTDEYPDVKKLIDEISRLKTRMKEKAALQAVEHEQPDNAAYITLSSQLSSTRAEIESLLSQKGDVDAKAEDYRQRIETTPTIEQEYGTLMTDRNNTRAKYEDLMRKVMEANVALGLEKEQKGERFTLIDPARMPERPFKPNRLAIALIGMVLGMGAGVGMAALFELSDQCVHSPKDLVRVSSLPMLVGIPTITTFDERHEQRLKYLRLGFCGLLLVGVVILSFHFLVMDLDVFWAKVLRRMPVI